MQITPFKKLVIAVVILGATCARADVSLTLKNKFIAEHADKGLSRRMLNF